MAAWFPAILPGAAITGADGAAVGEAAGVGDGPVGTGAGDGVAAVGVGDSAGDGASVGPPGLRSGLGRLIGTTRGSTPMSRRPMSSIPIQDKKARVGLWNCALNPAVERDSHAPPRDIHAPSVAPFKFLLSNFRMAN